MNDNLLRLRIKTSSKEVKPPELSVIFNSVLKQRDKVVSLGASLLSERTIFLFKSLIVMNVYAVAIGHNYIGLVISIVALWWYEYWWKRLVQLEANDSSWTNTYTPILPVRMTNNLNAHNTSLYPANMMPKREKKIHVNGCTEQYRTCTRHL